MEAERETNREGGRERKVCEETEEEGVSLVMHELPEKWEGREVSFSLSSFLPPRLTNLLAHPIPVSTVECTHFPLLPI